MCWRIAIRFACCRTARRSPELGDRRAVLRRWEVRDAFVIAVPEFVASAATDLSTIGSGLSAANAAAAAPTTAVGAAAGDEVSAAIASLFSWHAKEFQALGARAAAFHAEFVRALSGVGGAYSLTEAANASPLGTVEHDVLAVINAPTAPLNARTNSA